MGDYLRYAKLPDAEQRRLFLEIVSADPIVRAALAAARDVALPDWLLVSGLLYNSVWNALTGRPPGYGTKDIDLFYFEPTDLSYEAEDIVISRSAPHFAGLPLPVEIRNQARVHLWYPQKYGGPCPQYSSAAESVAYFASRTHAVGVRLSGDGHLELVAPFGVADIFAFRITPNHALDNRVTHESKGARAKAAWPQISVEAW